MYEGLKRRAVVTCFKAIAKLCIAELFWQSKKVERKKVPCCSV
jgi:hypothetical protein